MGNFRRHNLGRDGYFFCLASAIFFLAVSAFAHDPLHENQHANDTAYSDGHHRRHREEPVASVDLAAIRALVLSFRETGDDSSLDVAWQMLEPALELERLTPGNTNPDTLVSAAFVAQSRHDFDYSLQLLDQVLASDSRNDEARLLRASINLVRGNAGAAAKDCRRLRQASTLMRVTCSARVAVASGDCELALTRLQGVLNVVGAASLPSELLAWSYGVAGDLAICAAKAQSAVHSYEQSLRLAERTQVRAALVDVHISESNYESAWLSLDAGAAALPLLVRRLVVARRLGRVNELRSELRRVELEFEAWIRDEDWLHAREMARFYLDVIDRPGLARKLALINLVNQREPEDLRLGTRTRSRLAEDTDSGSVNPVTVLTVLK